jgi:hypothetical protein
VCITTAPLDSDEPSPKFQPYEYGEVPPVAVAVNVTGLPTVGLALVVNVTPRARGAITIVADAVAVLELALVAVTDTV